MELRLYPHFQGVSCRALQAAHPIAAGVAQDRNPQKCVSDFTVSKLDKNHRHCSANTIYR